MPAQGNTNNASNQYNYHIYSTTSQSGKIKIAKLYLEGAEIELIVDTGATVNCVTMDTINKAGLKKRMRRSTVKLFSASSAKLRVLGEVKAKVHKRGLRITSTWIVSDVIDNNKLGAPILNQCVLDMSNQIITYKKNPNTIQMHNRKQDNSVRTMQEEIVRP